MFDDWKNAWRVAVENFEREVRADGSADQGRGMRRQLATARGALTRLEAEIERAAAEAVAEREAEQVCIRRQTMACDIDDQETVRIAEEYAVRHAERASIYERKTEVLRDERELLVRDIEVMETEIGSHVPHEPISEGTRYTTATEKEEAEERLRHDHELARLRRERAASEKLEELKKRMRPE
ncbi:MAG: hypothetical protein ABIV28_02095 [Longimicrobiales bacterium]